MQRVNQQAFFNYLFNGAKGFILYTLYKDYVNKLNRMEVGEVIDHFGIDEDGYVPKAISTFSLYTGFEDDTVRKALKELESMGFIQSKPGNSLNKNITSFRPCYSSRKFIVFAKQKLEDKMSNKSEKNRNQAINILQPYIDLMESEDNFLVAIEMYKGELIVKNEDIKEVPH